jgi:HSP20 family protein
MAMTNPLLPLSKDFAEQLREQIRRMLARLDELRALASNPNVPNVPGIWLPAVDVCELEDAVLVRVEIPGVQSHHLRITLLDGVLKIEGRKERPNLTGRLLPEEERPLRFICLERSFGSFSFSVSLKWPIDAERISAKLADGVLQIRLPKTSACGREITIPITE